MIVTSCPASRSACERWNPTSPAPATTKYTLASLHRSLHGLEDHVGLVRERLPHEDFPHLAVLLQHRVEERAEDGGPGERVDPHLAVRLGAHWIGHFRDHLLDAKYLLGDLRRHEIAVVPLSEREERVGALDARLPQNLEIRAVPEDGLALEG